MSQATQSERGCCDGFCRRIRKNIPGTVTTPQALLAWAMEGHFLYEQIQKRKNAIRKLRRLARLATGAAVALFLLGAWGAGDNFFLAAIISECGVALPAYLAKDYFLSKNIEDRERMRELREKERNSGVGL